MLPDLGLVCMKITYKKTGIKTFRSGIKTVGSGIKGIAGLSKSLTSKNSMLNAGLIAEEQNQKEKQKNSSGINTGKQLNQLLRDEYVHKKKKNSSAHKAVNASEKSAEGGVYGGSGTTSASTASSSASTGMAYSSVQGTASAGAVGTTTTSSTVAAAGTAASSTGSVASTAGTAASGAAAPVMLAVEAGKTAKKTADNFKEALRSTQSKVMQEQGNAYTKANGRTPIIEDGIAGAMMNVVKDGYKGISGAITTVIATKITGFLYLLLSPVLIGLLPVLVIIVLLCGILSYEDGTNSNDQIVEVARSQVSSVNIGGYKYKEWYGMDADWCAMFVSWCANECGYIDDGIFVKSAGVAIIRSFYEQQGLFYKKGRYEPKAGDLIIFGPTGSKHIELVAGYDKTSGIITTIGGNTGTSQTTPYHKGSQVKEKKISIGYSDIYGFCTPKYPKEDDLETKGSTFSYADRY